MGLRGFGGHGRLGLPRLSKRGGAGRSPPASAISRPMVITAGQRSPAARRTGGGADGSSASPGSGAPSEGGGSRPHRLRPLPLPRPVRTPRDRPKPYRAPPPARRPPPVERPDRDPAVLRRRGRSVPLPEGQQVQPARTSSSIAPCLAPSRATRSQRAENRTTLTGRSLRPPPHAKSARGRARGARSGAEPLRRRPPPGSVTIPRFPSDSRRGAPRGRGGGPQVPKGLFIRRGGCSAIVYGRAIRENLEVCPRCDFHLAVSARDRVEMLADDGEYRVLSGGIRSRPAGIPRLAALRRPAPEGLRRHRAGGRGAGHPHPDRAHPGRPRGHGGDRGTPPGAGGSGRPVRLQTKRRRVPGARRPRSRRFHATVLGKLRSRQTTAASRSWCCTDLSRLPLTASSV